MDREEVVIELTKLRADSDALKKDLAETKEELKTWKKGAFSAVKYAMGFLIMGFASLWHLPADLRKSLVDWITK